MEINYNLILSGENFYNEYTLPKETTEVRFGTTERCDLVVPHSICNEDFSVILNLHETECRAVCSNAISFANGNHEEIFCVTDLKQVFLTSDKSKLFSIKVVIDFQKKQPKFDLGVELPQGIPVQIGGSDSCRIQIKDRAVGNDKITLKRDGASYYLWVEKATYGVYVNGHFVQDSQDVRNYTFLSLDGFQFYIRNGYLYMENSAVVTCPNDWNTVDNVFSKSHLDYPKFNKSTRMFAKPLCEHIEVLDPPKKEEQRKTNILLQLLPSLAMLALVIVLRGVLGGGGTFVIFSACSMSLGIFTSIASIITGKKDTKRNNEKRESHYRDYIQRKRDEIEVEQAKEKALLEEIYCSTERDIQMVKDFSPALFNRSPADDDFLQTYIGTGDQLSSRQVSYQKHETIDLADELTLMPETLSRDYKYIHGAPIWTDLGKSNVVGVVGDDQKLYGLMKNMTIDLCARQFYQDLALFYIVNTDFANYVSWLRWLPHVRNDALGVRNIVCSDESKNALFEYLYALLAHREQSKEKHPHIVVMLLNDTNIKSHPLSRYFNRCSSLGVCFVFFRNYEELLPDCCDELIMLESDTVEGTLRRRNDSAYPMRFTYQLSDDETVRQIALRLAPVYCEEIRLEDNLPQSYSLFDCLGIWSADDLNIADIWAASDVTKSMAVPIGITARKQPIYLDIHERAHGPHGLVAGTTGSGKSELLLSYILSMSLHFPPEDVGFLIIDFKGGGMANQLRALPHLVGAITNIDGRAITRSLKSIKAELKKRQHLFAQNDVSKIDDYIALYKAGKVEIPLPHLIIVVDEFAELKADQPEFMKELISAARIGRSLGVHLILATQKPSGQVNEQIWSNSRFRMCLKVQTPQDSNEMLKSPLAAEIREPGRAYLQVGNDEVFELFQSGYSGGAAEYSQAVEQDEFQLAEVEFWGKRKLVYKHKSRFHSEGGKTQLEAVIDAINMHCSKFNVKRLPSICLPELPEVLAFPDQEKRPDLKGGVWAELGVYDDPDNQYIGKFSIDLSQNNLMIIGSSRTGKTSILQNIIKSLSLRYTPSEVSIYVIDFASRALKNFEKLNHIGGVVCQSDEEKLKNLFKLLYTEIESRKEKLLSIGISSFSAYQEAGMTDMPLIVLMIDNLTVLKELYLQDNDQLLGLCREGLTVGLSIVIANAQMTGIGYKYLSNFSSRIALFCNDQNEYHSLFEHCSERIENVPGRCLVEIEKRHLECQAYLAFGGEKEIDRVQNIQGFVQSANKINQSLVACPIPQIPAVLNDAYILDNFGACMQEEFSIITGLDYETVTPHIINLSSTGLLAITGHEDNVKYNWMQYVVEMLEAVYPGRSKIYILDSFAKNLSEMKNVDNLAAYSIMAEDAVSYVKEIEAQLKLRYDALVAGNENALANSELLVLVIDNQDALLAICNDKEALEAYKNIVGRYKNMRSCMFAFIENANIPYSASEILKNVRDQKQMMFFDDMANMKIFDAPLAMTRNFKKPIERGDGYYIKENTCVKLKTVLTNEAKYSKADKRGGLSNGK